MKFAVAVARRDVGQSKESAGPLLTSMSSAGGADSLQEIWAMMDADGGQSPQLTARTPSKYCIECYITCVCRRNDLTCYESTHFFLYHFIVFISLLVFFFREYEPICV